MKDKLEILLSCMHQTVDIIKRSNIKCNATIVNQCDKDDKRMFEFYSNEETSMINWIDSSERGLSRSRNMALHSASCDYCLISDDDEVFVDGVDKIIEKAFRDNPQSDVLIFKLNNWETKYPSHTKNVGYIQAMRTASYQIAFRRAKIVENKIFFDEEMGSGTGAYGGSAATGDHPEMPAFHRIGRHEWDAAVIDIGLRSLRGSRKEEKRTGKDGNRTDL